MVETVLAVLIVTFAFLTLFRLSTMLTGKILLEHAAMRVARARAVGFNDYMCRKAARVAVIPVAGRRTWPESGTDWQDGMERARVSAYLASENEAEARGILDYARWGDLAVAPGDGTDARVSLGFELLDDAARVGLSSEAGIEPNHSLYLNDAGR